MDVLNVIVNNLFKENLYEKKKKKQTNKQFFPFLIKMVLKFF